MDLLTLLLLFSIFLFALSLVVLLYLTWVKNRYEERWMIKKRLMYISAGGRHGTEKLLQYKNRALNKVGPLEKWAYSLPRVRGLDRMLLRSGIPLNVSTFLLGSVAVAFMALLLGLKFLPHPFSAANPYASLLIGVCLGCVPFAWLRMKERQALSKFEEQLPDALDLLARSLRSGHALSAGMDIITEEMADPIGSEFAATIDEINLGLSFNEAMENFCERVASRDLRFFAVAVLIQRETGGNLAEIIDQISRLIRERMQFRGQVKTLTAEARISGVVLTLLPAFMFVAIYFTNPEYISLLWSDSLGYLLIIAGIVFQVAGTIVIKKMVNVEI